MGRWEQGDAFLEQEVMLPLMCRICSRAERAGGGVSPAALHGGGRARAELRKVLAVTA